MKLTVFRRRRLDGRTIVAVAVGAAVGLIIAVWPSSDRAASLPDELPQAGPARAAPVRGATVTLVAVGDIACAPSDEDFDEGLGSGGRCRQAAVAAVAAALDSDAVLPLGDVQYEEGTADAFREAYGLTWGRFLPITFPAPGNHEYQSSSGADGYYEYFGARAGIPGAGWYSYNLGAWHVISLNSNCAYIEGCHPGSPEYEWLADDLGHNRRRCTLAYWHHPRFTSGPHENARETAPFWGLLYSAGADVVLSAHDHNYQRFDPMTASGALDRRTGIREFVVGTGGKEHYDLDEGSPSAGPVRPSATVHDDTSYGVLELTLQAQSYRWRFVPAAGGTFTDSGRALCHGRP